MFLGKITFKVETINPKWFFCRPIAFANNEEFPSQIGICHVVYIKKSEITKYLQRGDIFTVYGIFDKVNSREFYDRTKYIKSKIEPITQEIYDSLKEIYPQQNHAFLE